MNVSPILLENILNHLENVDPLVFTQILETIHEGQIPYSTQMISVKGDGWATRSGASSRSDMVDLATTLKKYQNQIVVVSLTLQNIAVCTADIVNLWSLPPTIHIQELILQEVYLDGDVYAASSYGCFVGSLLQSLEFIEQFQWIGKDHQQAIEYRNPIFTSGRKVKVLHLMLEPIYGYCLIDSWISVDKLETAHLLIGSQHGHIAPLASIDSITRRCLHLVELNVCLDTMYEEQRVQMHALSLHQCVKLKTLHITTHITSQVRYLLHAFLSTLPHSNALNTLRLTMKIVDTNIMENIAWLPALLELIAEERMRLIREWIEAARVRGMVPRQTSVIQTNVVL
ncbi:hypothetical protein K474DRAFT_1680369 [Panus rudis PR-1116 ss-1]|nr:hypothetical protein K474DRAFT_1680369 [Panus rudis PR-1116 ss-1]